MTEGDGLGKGSYRNNFCGYRGKVVLASTSLSSVVCKGEQANNS
jgi:hypothetical protein